MKLTVTRAFLLRGERQGVGTTVEVGDAFGRELVAMGKAAFTSPAVPSGPMTTQTTPAVVSGPKPAAPAAAKSIAAPAQKAVATPEKD